MHQQISDPEELTGATIERVVHTEDQVWILLEGERFAIIEAVEGHHDELPFATLRTETPEFNSSWKREGICTEAEYQALDALRFLDMRKARDRRDRRNYERLRRKFEFPSRE